MTNLIFQLGKGFLAGSIKKPEDIPETDMRRRIPRFQGQSFYENLKIVKAFEDMAKTKGYVIRSVWHHMSTLPNVF